MGVMQAAEGAVLATPMPAARANARGRTNLPRLVNYRRLQATTALRAWADSGVAAALLCWCMDSLHRERLSHYPCLSRSKCSNRGKGTPTWLVLSRHRT